jgi:hypothetical protein
MLGKLFISLVCVSMLLQVLVSCDILASPGDQGNPADQEDVRGQGAEENASGDDLADPDDPGNDENPDSEDGQDAGDDSDDEEDSEEGEGAGDQPDPGEDEEEDESVLNGAAAVLAFLDGQEQNTPENPYGIKVRNIKLSGTGAGNALKGLYFALSRYVDLDLGRSYGENFANITAETARNKNKITGIILPPELRTINVNAFIGCTELVSADLSGVATISGGAFNGCVKLATLVTDQVSELKDASASGKQGVFGGCVSLVSVSLPRVALIGNKAFAGCENLASLALGETPPTLGKDVFAAGKPEAIYVPASSVDTYKNTTVTGWTDELKAKVQSAP